MQRFSDEYYRELEIRLRALEPLVADCLKHDAARFYAEFLDVGEYGLAVETATDNLVEAPAGPSGANLARGLLAEAEVMDLDDSYHAQLRQIVNASGQDEQG